MTSLENVVSRLRGSGTDYTLALIRDYLTKGSVARPAVWYLLEHVAVLAIGGDARGLAIIAPHSSTDATGTRSG